MQQPILPQRLPEQNAAKSNVHRGNDVGMMREPVCHATAAPIGGSHVSNGHTVDNQRQALAEAIGRRASWIIAAEFVDDGISGAKGRDKRPAFDRLLKAVVRRRSTSLLLGQDRLGRSLQHLIGFLGEPNAAGVDLYLEKQAVDTTTPAGRALFQVLGVFAEFERAIIQECIHAGLARARESNRATRANRG